jgi:hypothetical protein
VEASRKLSGRDELRVAGGPDDLLERHLVVRAGARGRPGTCSWRSGAEDRRRSRRRPRPDSRGRIVQRASTDASIGDIFSGESPIIITRLSEESGWIICGGCETFGFACACVSCSLDELPRLGDAGPGWNSMVIDERPGTDSGAQDRRALHAVEEVGLQAAR